MAQLLQGLLFLLVLGASSSVEVLDETSSPASPKQCNSLLQAGTRAEGSVEVIGSDEDDSSSKRIVKKVEGSKKKAKHSEPPTSGDDIDALKAEAAHKARVLQSAIAQAEDSDDKMGNNAKRMGQDLEDARVNGGKLGQHIEVLNQALATAKEAASSCLALSDVMQKELGQEKVKAQGNEQAAAAALAKLQQARNQVAALQAKINELQHQLEEGKKMEALAERLEGELKETNEAKEQIGNELSEFKEAMGSKIEQMNAENEKLKRQIAEMEKKFEAAEKAASILRPYSVAQQALAEQQQQQQQQQ